MYFNCMLLMPAKVAQPITQKMRDTSSKTEQSVKSACNHELGNNSVHTMRLTCALSVGRLVK
jgi:hypothetical protein